MLRSMRARGAQKMDKDKCTLLRYYLRLLKIVFSPPHPFSDVIAWFNNIFFEAHLVRELNTAIQARFNFKRSLEWGYSRTITCLKKKAGEAHPVILYMTVQHASEFLIGATRRGDSHNINKLNSVGFLSNTYQRESIRQKYQENLDQLDSFATQALRQEEVQECRVSLMLMKMFSATVGSKLDDVALARQSATFLFETSLAYCTSNLEPLVQTSVYSRALYHSTLWLGNRLFEERNTNCFIMMDTAIENLRHGDYGCRIWAFSLSKRLYMWYRTERRKEKEPFVRECERQQLISQTIPQAPVVKGFNLCGVHGKERVKLLRQRSKAEQAGLLRRLDTSILNLVVDKMSGKIH